MAPRSERQLPKDDPNAKPLDGVAIRRLLALARPEAGRLVVGMVFLFIGSVTTLLYPQGLKYLVDEVLTKRRTDLLDRAAQVLLVAFAVQAAAVALRYYLFSTSGERIVTRLRDSVYR